jgi:hyaluronan synthase
VGAHVTTARAARRRARLGARALNVVATGYLVALCAAIVAYKAVFVEMVLIDPFFTVYGLTVCGYILSRFFLSLFYRPGKGRDSEHEPTVAIVMPAFNEEDAIARSVRSLLDVDYPREKLEVIVVDDGSTDGTAAEIARVRAEAGGRVQLITFPENRGKRAAMAAGMRASTAEVLAFVDSDSVLEPAALRTLMQGFADPSVGAICGHADVLNTRESWLTRMQAVRYFVAFRVLKAAESLFDAVTCCSGCFAAYRRAAIMPHLDAWEHQRFLGRPATFGDDRSLTNYVLRDWKVRYEAAAVSHTIVPSTFHKFLVQQMRWKRSWARESLVVGGFIWRKHPVAGLSTYVSIVLPMLAPIVVARALAWRPLVEGAGTPFIYLLGIYVLALVYGLYYAIRTQRYDDTLWIYGVIFVFFYLVFLVWQTYWAVLTANRSSWGTRPSTHQAPA